MAYPNSTNKFDVEELMGMIQRRVDERPDAKSILAQVEDGRRLADGILESTSFSANLTSKVKSLVYKGLLRVFKGNFERQRCFNHAVIDALQLIAEDMYKLQRRLPANDAQTNPDKTAGSPKGSKRE